MIAPRLGREAVPGPPKRFAQGMGAVMSTAALLLGADRSATTPPPTSCSACSSAAAGLESIFAVCLGCQVFALLMRAGLIPETRVRRVRRHLRPSARLVGRGLTPTLRWPSERGAAQDVVL